MENNHAKAKVISSLFWKLLERGGTQGVQFLVQIVLARLLAPEQFGTIAIEMVFINLAQVFVQSGFNTALVQNKDADDVDFSSVLYLSLAVALVLYILLFFASPFISDFYRAPELTSVLRVIGVVLFFGAFNSIQNAYIAKHLLFKKLFYSSFGAIVISGLVGVAAAYIGLGVWALVLQQLFNQISVTIIMWFTVKWRPKLVFSWNRVKILFSFGWKLLASSLIDRLYLDLRPLIIGRIYDSSTLAFYNRGQQFPQVIVSNINGSIQSVMLPTLSAYQEDKVKVKSIMRRAIVTSSFFIFPLMIGMAIVAEPLVIIVLTDKWLSAVPFLQIFCFTYMLMPIHTANLQAINAIGRSDIFLKLEIVKKTYGIIILIISLPFGVYAMAIGELVSSLISSFVNAYPNKKLLNYGYGEQIKDIAPSFVTSVIMGVLVYLVRFLNFSIWSTLIIQVALGVVIYIILAKLFRLDSFSYLLTTIRQLKEARGSKND